MDYILSEPERSHVTSILVFSPIAVGEEEKKKRRIQRAEEDFFHLKANIFVDDEWVLPMAELHGKK